VDAPGVAAGGTARTFGMKHDALASGGGQHPADHPVVFDLALEDMARAVQDVDLMVENRPGQRGRCPFAHPLPVTVTTPESICPSCSISATTLDP
jgi:hypothetical protein